MRYRKLQLFPPNICKQQIAKALLISIGYEILICVQPIWNVRYVYFHHGQCTTNIARTINRTLMFYQFITIYSRGFLGMAMFIRSAILKNNLRDVNRLHCSSEHLRWNCTERFAQSFGSSIDHGSEKFVVLLPLFLLLGADNYKRSLSLESTVLPEVPEARFKSRQSTASSEEEAKKKVLRQAFNNSALKKRFVKSLSYTSSFFEDNSARCFCVAAWKRKSGIEIFHVNKSVGR